MAVWMSEAGEWARAWRWDDATIFHWRLSSLTYRLADQQLYQRGEGSTQVCVCSYRYQPYQFSLVQLFCPMAAVSGVHMPSQLGGMTLAGPGGAGLPAVSFTNTSVTFSPTPTADTGGCENGALMDPFGIFLQGLLAVMAFSTLMCEYDKGLLCLWHRSGPCWYSDHTLIQWHLLVHQ